jgi:ADP-heptose:LPS heptosyltransferase
VHCVINKVRRKTVRTLRWRLLFSAMTTEIAPLDPSFRRFRDLLFRTDLAIGCDSGPMHFASLLGVPTLVIYGRYPANEFAPLWRTEAVSPAAGMDPDTVAVAAVEAALGRLIDRLQHAPMDLDETNRA